MLIIWLEATNLKKPLSLIFNYQMLKDKIKKKTYIMVKKSNYKPKKSLSQSSQPVKSTDQVMRSR
jgi:hypothetical protein